MATTHFDLTSLFPTLAALLKSLADLLRTPAPVPVPVPTPDNPPPLNPQAPNQAIKDLQTFLNAALSLNPPLVVDGWLGPKTDAAIEAGIVKIRSYGIG
jgi:hypothetical protein